MAFAPPAVRDNFLYSGDLYVDVGNLNRHKRASVAEITEVLRPDLKKPKNGAPVKDPVGHWYEAQLIHYGLPPSKDKARAKMRLLENLNNSNLKVPAHVAAIESELKKEFTAAERKAKAQHKAAMTATAPSPSKSVPSKKRKEAESQNQFPSVSVNINFGGSSPFQDNPAPAKKPKLQTARRGGSKSVPAPELSRAASQSNQSSGAPALEAPQPRTKQTARRGGPSSNPRKPVHVTHSDLQESAPSPPAENPKPRPKQTARRSNPSSFARKAPPVSHADMTTTSAGTNPQPPPLKKAAQPKKEKEKKPPVKKEPKIKPESSTAQSPKVKSEANTGSKAIIAPPLGLINGIYEISCPRIEQEWACDGFTLVLTLDTPGVWGAYDFGMFTGIMHIPERPYTASNSQALPFYWRGRENGEGEMSFGDNCEGEIRFLGNGFIEGWISLYGECQFEGTRRDGPGTPVRTARSMQHEWDEYNEEQYEYERVARWGGGGW